VNSEHDEYLFKCEKCDIEFKGLVDQEVHNNAFDEMLVVASVASDMMVHKDIDISRRFILML